MSDAFLISNIPRKIDTRFVILIFDIKKNETDNHLDISMEYLL